ncbi:MAG: hypothetical protein HY611_03285 [Elusimicrobia bacterium]|nr:hypothetical protein [Elusimicrobiota bacterium]
MTAQPQRRPVALDATVIINLIDMGQIGILPKLREFEFWVPNHVKSEVHRRNHRLQLRTALRARWITELEIVDLAEIELYAEYRSRFGQGESACMAVARTRGWSVASDDRAVKRDATRTLGAERLLDTKGLLEAAVRAGILDQEDFEKICNSFGL